MLITGIHMCLLGEGGGYVEGRERGEGEGVEIGGEEKGGGKVWQK